MPLPQRGVVQLVSQASPLVVLPSSHCSPGSTTPLPQRGVVQLVSQASPLVALPSSHCSPGSMMPLPHAGRHDGAPAHAGSLQSLGDWQF